MSDTNINNPNDPRYVNRPLDTDDNIQHGIDDSPSGDAEKGALLGGIGGAVVGALAGGPVGAIIGAVAGAAASGPAVAAVDRIDNDNTVSGLGDPAYDTTTDPITGTHTPRGYAGGPAPIIDNGIPGVQTGGVANDGTPDTRGMGEKLADGLTGDVIDDKTGKVVNHPNTPAYDMAAARVGSGPAPIVDNGVPGVQTGGYANDGTPDTRGIMEKAADAVTGDVYDDKTGKPVLHPDHPGDTTYTRNDVVDTGLTRPAPVIDNGIPGVQTGGLNNDGSPDTRGITEKVSDAVTGDRYDDKTGKRI